MSSPAPRRPGRSAAWRSLVLLALLTSAMITYATAQQARGAVLAWGSAALGLLVVEGAVSTFLPLTRDGEGSGRPSMQAPLTRWGVVSLAMLVVSQVVACAVIVPSRAVLLPVAVWGVVRTVGRLSAPLLLVVCVAAADFVLLIEIGLADRSGREVLGPTAAFLALALLAAAIRRMSKLSQERERDALRREIEVQEARAAQAASEERARIARELHDVLAHSRGALGLQLDAVEALVEAGRWDEATARITRCRGLAADGLAEAREAVVALREAPVALVPELERLAAVHREAGGDVDLHVPAEVPETGPAATAALSRAGQEMLTNTLRYAPGRAARLTLSVAEERDPMMTLTCTNTAPGALTGPIGGGRGLAGMRERCQALGGSVRWSSGPDGRFTVTAQVPVVPAQSAGGGR